MKFLIITVAICSLALLAHACPYCADTIHNTDATSSASSLGGAFNLSIYCMFLGLFTALGIVVKAVVKGIRN